MFIVIAVAIALGFGLIPAVAFLLLKRKKGNIERRSDAKSI